MPIRQRRITALSAVTATTTSSKFYVGEGRRICIHMRAAAITSGNGAFTIKASPEPIELASGTTRDEYGNPVGGAGITVTALNMWLDNVINTNAQSPTRVNGTTLSANGDKFLFLDLPAGIVNWLEITVTRTTDGTYSAWIITDEELPQYAGN